MLFICWLILIHDRSTRVDHLKINYHSNAIWFINTISSNAITINSTKKKSLTPVTCQPARVIHRSYPQQLSISASKYTILSAIKRSRNILLEEKSFPRICSTGSFNMGDFFPLRLSVYSLGATKYYPRANFIRIHDVWPESRRRNSPFWLVLSPQPERLSHSLRVDALLRGKFGVFPSTPSREALLRDF